MCCFSGPVLSVSATKIFAKGRKGNQLLVYSMQFSAGNDLAMILPLPVPARSADDAVKFINMEGYPNFFDDIAMAFPKMRSDDVPSNSMSFQTEKPLEVHSVGAFEASFVPTRGDFKRLDPRFRFSDQIWKDLPGYADWGFAVFKLKAGTQNKVHPMAFEFPRRDPGKLFFPTLHIHDGKVEAKADFDHALYCQGDRSELKSLPWIASSGKLSKFMQAEKLPKDLVDLGQGCFQYEMAGSHPNQDTWG